MALTERDLVGVIFTVVIVALVLPLIIWAFYCAATNDDRRGTTGPSGKKRKNSDVEMGNATAAPPQQQPRQSSQFRVADSNGHPSMISDIDRNLAGAI